MSGNGQAGSEAAAGDHRRLRSPCCGAGALPGLAAGADVFGASRCGAMRWGGVGVWMRGAWVRGCMVERDSFPRVVKRFVSGCGRGVKLGLGVCVRGVKVRSRRSGVREAGGIQRAGGVVGWVSRRGTVGVRRRLSRPRCTLRSTLGAR
jgi:hypothetical protein